MKDNEFMSPEELIRLAVKQAEAYELQCQKEYAIKEIEKIKAEISTLGFRYPAINSVDRLIEGAVIDRILDNHISELKGE